jgi:hypothetical protein
MKHLLRGVALVALFAVIVPAWAEAPNTSPAAVEQRGVGGTGEGCRCA